jgi:hypothetical protein
LNIVLKTFFGQYFTTTVKADFLIISNKWLKVNSNNTFRSSQALFCPLTRKSTSSDFRVGVNLNNRSFNILSGASSNLTLVGKSSFTYLSFPFSHGFSFDYFNFWNPSLNLGGMLGFIVNDNRKRYNSNGSITDIDELAETMYHYELDQFELFPIYFQFSLTNVFPINEKVSILLEPNFLVPLRTKHYSDDGSSNFVFTLKLGMNYKLY